MVLLVCLCNRHWLWLGCTCHEQVSSERWTCRDRQDTRTGPHRYMPCASTDADCLFCASIIEYVHWCCACNHTGSWLSQGAFAVGPTASDTHTHTHTHTSISLEHVQCYHTEGDSFLEQTDTGDETCCHHFVPMGSSRHTMDTLCFTMTKGIKVTNIH